MEDHRNKTRSFLLGLFLLPFLSCLINTKGLAATFNVSNATQLRNALNTAASNLQADTINIVSGTYSTAGNTFTYIAGSGENFALTIVGAGNTRTILDGGNNSRVLQITTALFSLNDSKRNITIRNLAVRNGFEDFASGGGLFVQTLSAKILIENCRFSNSFGESGGGGARVVTNSGSITLTDNAFTDSSAGDASGGGASVSASSGLITLTNNTFTDNSANRNGGGADINSVSGLITLTNNTFTDNSATLAGGGASVITDTGAITLRDNTFTNNSAPTGGGARVFTDSDRAITLTNNTFTNNSAPTADGRAGGAIVGTDTGAITLTNNTFTSNFAFGDGGGGAEIFFRGRADIFAVITLTNNTFTSNSADFGGGVKTNFAFSSGAILNIYNNIVFGNTADPGRGKDIFIRVHDTETINLFNNDFSEVSSECSPDCSPNIVQGGNIDQDPLFVDAQNGDVHLGTGSPAINAGSNVAPSLPATDFEGNPRILDSLPDIGADEALTCDGLFPTIVGTISGEFIEGTAGPDVILGFGGPDTINGLGGADRICGGDDGDTINGGGGADRLFGERGNDTINGGGANDQLFGGANDDTLNGGDNTDTCDFGGGQVSGIATNCETVTDTMAGFSGVWAGDVIQTCDESDENLVCTIEGILEVENPGVDRAEQSLLRFFLSADELLDEEDNLVQETPVDPIEPQEIVEVNLQGQLQPGQDATGQFVIAILDATDVVSEINEENNVVVSSAIVGQQGGGGNGGCTTVAGPVQIGTSTANILILLIPVFVIGLRVLINRRGKVN